MHTRIYSIRDEEVRSYVLGGEDLTPGELTPLDSTCVRYFRIFGARCGEGGKLNAIDCGDCRPKNIY